MRVSSRRSALSFFCVSVLMSSALASGCGSSPPDDADEGAGGTIPNKGECTKSADCEAPLSHCTDWGECVACLESDHCDTGFCDDQNRCVFCLEDDHCDGGVCNPDGHCLECLTGSDCASGHCLGNECLPEGMCAPGADCADGFRCVARASGATRGFCELECDVLAEDPCPDDLLCTLRGFDETSGDPIGTCVEPNGGAGEQDSCRSEEVQCEENLLCVARTPIDLRCNSLCDVEAETSTCAPGSTCEEVVFQSGATIGACIADKIPCTDNADCPDDERCSITARGEMICIQAVGPKEGGDACTTGLECDAGLCLGDFCFGACSDSDSCFEGGACLPRFLTNNDGMFWFIPVCVPTCTSDTDCGEEEACRYETSSRPYGFVGACGIAIGTLENGEDCSSSSECRSGNCLLRPEGYCAGMCETEDDCGPRTTCTDTLLRAGSGEDGRINTEDDILAVQRVCTPFECVNDTDCPGDWICKPEEMVGWTPSATLTLRCGPKLGDMPAGSECELDRDCETGRCLKSQEPGGAPFCFGACEIADAECSEGLRCVQEAAQIPYGLGHFASYPSCIP